MHSTRRTTPFATRTILIIAIAAAMPACSTRVGGGKASEAANLARRVTDLEREVQAQTLRASEAEAKLYAAAQQSDEITRATPVLAGLEVDRLSGPTPSDLTGFPVFVRTLDGRARFIQVVGRLEISVLAAPKGGAGEPVRVGGASLGPLEVREAYRSGVAGTHYRVDIVADDAFLRSSAFRGSLSRHDLRIVARFDDALTGRSHEATTIIPARDRVPTK